MKNEFKNKKVLLIGLGILGGGVSISNWLIKQGAILTVTDSKPKEYFKDSIKQINGKVSYIFESCPDSVVESADIIVLNQAIPQNNHLVLLAEKLHKPIYNESKIFYESCKKPIIAITGTRGKTTTTNWTAHLIGKSALIAGNSVKEPLLKVLPKTKGKKCKLVINEIPSFQLERFNSSPAIAMITNIFVDHLNRHGTLENYALAKANIFKNQTKKEKLILNYDNEWTKFFLKQKPASEVWFFSINKSPKNINLIYYKNGDVFLQTKDNKVKKVLSVYDFVEFWGKHNLSNLLAGALAANLSGEKWSNIQKRIKTLPQVKYRQELILNHKKTNIINDTSATSPEGGTAAVERFHSKNCVLITGGTDAGLEYIEWAKTLVKKIPIDNIVMLNGSATIKMLAELKKYVDISKISVKESLRDCILEALEKINNLNNPGQIKSQFDGARKDKFTLLFSPSAKSFEKFKNEFDRGEQFNKLIKQNIKKIK